MNLPTQLENSSTVVICTHNRPHALDRCLEAIAQLSCPPGRVLVVDNDPQNSDAKAVAARWNVDYLIEPVRGLSRARNAGARACKGEIVAFLDDDAIPDPGWMSALCAAFTNEIVVAVTGRTLVLEPAADAKETLPLIEWDLGDQPRYLDGQNPLWFEIASFGGIGNGVNMAFRRKVFNVWPGFNERLGRGAPLCGGEEHQAFSSLVGRGYAIRYAPDAVVYHPSPVTRREARARHLSEYSNAVGYFLFLLFESGYPRKVIRYLIEAARGQRRAWRGLPPKQPSGLHLSGLRLVPASIRGVWQYLRSRLVGGDSSDYDRKLLPAPEAAFHLAPQVSAHPAESLPRPDCQDCRSLSR